MKVSELMTRKLITVRPLESIEGVIELLQGRGVRHILVMDKTVLVGIISDRDLKPRDGSDQDQKKRHVNRRSLLPDGTRCRRRDHDDTSGDYRNCRQCQSSRQGHGTAPVWCPAGCRRRTRGWSDHGNRFAGVFRRIGAKRKRLGPARTEKASRKKTEHSSSRTPSSKKT